MGRVMSGGSSSLKREKRRVVCVMAAAGSGGKTTTLEHVIHFLVSRKGHRNVHYAVFNKQNAAEAVERIARPNSRAYGAVNCSTIDSMVLQILNREIEDMGKFDPNATDLFQLIRVSCKDEINKFLGEMSSNILYADAATVGDEKLALKPERCRDMCALIILKQLEHFMTNDGRDRPCMAGGIPDADRPCELCARRSYSRERDGMVECKNDAFNCQYFGLWRNENNTKIPILLLSRSCGIPGTRNLNQIV